MVAAADGNDGDGDDGDGGIPEKGEEAEFVLPPGKKPKNRGRPTTHPSTRTVQASINRRNIFAALSNR